MRDKLRNTLKQKPRRSNSLKKSNRFTSMFGNESRRRRGIEEMADIRVSNPLTIERMRHKDSFIKRVMDDSQEGFEKADYYNASGKVEQEEVKQGENDILFAPIQ